MSPYEITQPGGSIEHWNEEAGAVWMQRLCSAFPAPGVAQPGAPARWEYTPSVRMTRELVGDRMFPLTLAGLDRAIDELRRPLNGAVSGARRERRHDRVRRPPLHNASPCTRLLMEAPPRPQTPPGSAPRSGWC